MRFNSKFLLSFILIFILEAIIAIYIHDSIVRPLVGDALVIILIYCFIMIFVPKKIVLLPVYIFAFAVVVEISQYFNLIKLLGLEHNTFARNIIGSTFDVSDIICYFIGCIILLLLQKSPWFLNFFAPKHIERG